MAKILLVDDEPRIARVVRDMVEGADWQFAYADNGADALDAVAREAPDLIIMDVMMPKMDGFTACRELRARGVTVPVIFLSAKGDIVDKGVGFAAGGDDYMVKPFDPRELMMHIEAHLRRAAMRPTAAMPSTGTITVGRLSLDMAQHRATLGGEHVPLTPKEFKILATWPQVPAPCSPANSWWKRRGDRSSSARRVPSPCSSRSCGPRSRTIPPSPAS